jgi:ribosomal RNA-processing protein 12
MLTGKKRRRGDQGATPAQAQAAEEEKKEGHAQPSEVRTDKRHQTGVEDSVPVKTKRDIHVVKESGDAFRSKNPAGHGDVRLPNKPEPYAFIQLNPKVAALRGMERLIIECVGFE